MRHILESLLTIEGKSWLGSWARASGTRDKAQQASIAQACVHVQVEVEVHDEQVPGLTIMGRSPKKCAR